MTPILLLAPDLAADPGRDALAERLRLRGTALVPVEGAPGHRPLLRAAAGRPAWLATADPAWIPAAATAGCIGVVMIGACDPGPHPGLVLAATTDLLDAPRVMIPPGGGCWHGA
ncbi:MAG: hypothetical protein RLZZ127_1279 [Planctomycetota bacterium]|jgi:hypothetical protein